jgi:hypothetical protein
MSGYALWNSITTYALNDIVSYDDKIFVSLQNLNTNNVPTTSPTWWSQTGGTGSLSQLNAGDGIRITGGAGSTRTVYANLVSPDSRTIFTTGAGTQLIITDTTPASIAGTGGEIISSGTNPTGITLTLNTAGTAGTTADPISITTDSYGRATALTAGSAPVTALNAGAGIGVVGSTVSNTGVVGLTAGAGIGIVGSTISNDGLVGLTVANEGAGITIGGTATSPTISNGGVLGLTAGAGILIGGTTSNPVITDTAEVSATTVVSRIYFAGNQPDFPIAPNGATGDLNVTLDGPIVNDINNGNTTFPNGIWVLNFSSLMLRWDTDSSVINTLVYSFTDGANTYTPNNPEQRLYRLNAGGGDVGSVVNDVGCVSFNPNALKALGFFGANTTLRIQNLSPNSSLYLLNIPTIAYATFYPYGY